ncbi:hypothetical protein MRS44_018098 [Fusarium solani]|uniref:uncharacterized protein n=1 Tax=Fusarium solani TaxID=169388 RepID=UPI0032C4A6FE|nr:hypothetical protein MRS44_018098 [Fusarium solani]
MDLNIVNGSAPTEEAFKSPRKAFINERFTRMFLQQGCHTRNPDPAAQPNDLFLNGASSPLPGMESSPEKSGPDETVTKPTEKPAPSVRPVKNLWVKEQSQRFILNPDVPGGHEHHFGSSRRQEKLSDMWRSIFGKKQEAPDHGLPLVSDLVASLKQGAGDRKGGPSVTSAMVEKYGKCQEVVGRGAFGVVRISRKKLGGSGDKLFTVKELRRRPEETEKGYSKRLTAEFWISSSLRHPNVVYTLDLLQDAKGDYCEVMEFCTGGDLCALIESSDKLEAQEADCFFKQMMRGVEYLHAMGVAHRDLKPENLLLTNRAALKITDFGNSECIRMAWETDAHMVSGLCGSVPYIAPEEYMDKEFDARAVDVWACGVVYMAMRTGRHPWRLAKKDEDEVYARYLQGRRHEEGYGPIESLHRARCRNVIYSVLDPHPTRRLTAAQVLKSEWVREIQLCKAGEDGL